MDTSNILKQLKNERDGLEKAIAALEGLDSMPQRGTRIATAPKHSGRRHMSAAARRRISEAQRARWAAQKKAASKRALKVPPKKAVRTAAKAAPKAE